LKLPQTPRLLIVNINLPEEGFIALRSNKWLWDAVHAVPVKTVNPADAKATADAVPADATD
jgi:hypothetical protein